MRGLSQESGTAVIRTIQRKQNAIGVGILLLATVVALIFLLRVMTDPQNITQTTVSITGTTTCLTHKESPATLECTVGLHGDDGRYYALTSQTNQLPTDTNKAVRVTGDLAAPKSGEIYNIAGTINVTSIEEQ